VTATIDIPKVGHVPKVAVVGVGVAAAGFVGWKWWNARNAVPAGDPTADGSFQDPGTLPAVAGAGTVPYGGTGSDAGTGQITTNSAWTNDALAKLTATGAYDAGKVAEALGNYLGAQPLSTEQQAIVRAAIAVSGNPPVGTFYIVPGGNVGLSAAPSGLHVTGVTTSSATLAFTGVNGATSYVAYRNGVAAQSASSSPITLTGLSQNTSYTVHVVAKTASGLASPDSPSITFKTAVSGVPAPTGVKATAASNSTITLSWNAVPNAKGYRIIVNGVQNGGSVLYNAGSARYLKPNTSYRVGIQALSADDKPGPSTTITARTKK
jgi:hypothetical protein